MSSAYRKCIVPGCDKRHLNTLRTFFSFPKNHEDLIRWCRNLNIKHTNTTLIKKLVCSEHFHPYEYTKRLVKRGAVPTLYLGYKPKETSMVEPSGRSRRCCLKYCKNTSKVCIVFSFPIDENLRNEWCARTLRDFYAKNNYLCQAHFEPENIRGKRLVPGAVPTENLPYIVNVDPVTDTNTVAVEAGSLACVPIAELIGPIPDTIVANGSDVPVDDIKLENSREYLDLEEKSNKQVEKASISQERQDPDIEVPRQVESVNDTWLQTKIADLEGRLFLMETRLKIIEEKYPI